MRYIFWANLIICALTCRSHHTIASEVADVEDLKSLHNFRQVATQTTSSEPPSVLNESDVVPPLNDVEAQTQQQDKRVKDTSSQEKPARSPSFQNDAGRSETRSKPTRRSSASSHPKLPGHSQYNTPGQMWGMGVWPMLVGYDIMHPAYHWAYQDPGIQASEPYHWHEPSAPQHVALVPIFQVAGYAIEPCQHVNPILEGAYHNPFPQSGPPAEKNHHSDHPYASFHPHTGSNQPVSYRGDDKLEDPDSPLTKVGSTCSASPKEHEPSGSWNSEKENPKKSAHNQCDDHNPSKSLNPHAPAFAPDEDDESRSTTYQQGERYVI